MAFSRGMLLIPDLDFDAPNAIRLDSLVAFEKFLTRTRKFFLIAPSYEESPPSMRSVLKGDRMIYYIFPKSGGPLIELSLCIPFEQDGRKAIRAGFLAYLPKYESSLLKIDLPVPTAVVRLYKDLVDLLASKSEKRKGKKGLYLLDDALKASVTDVRLGEDAVFIS